MFNNRITVSLTIFILALLITLTIFFIISPLDLKPYFSAFSSSPPQPPCTVTHQQPPSPPLKVFMYDLPRKFNVAMLDRRNEDADAAAPATAESFPPWPQNFGVGKQHSVEYWMMGSMVSNGSESEEEGRAGVRVLDPEVADVFFVPFFSSMSFNTHGRNMTDPDTEIDHQLQIDLLNFLRQSKYWQRSGGRDHVIPMTHPNAFRFLREEVNASILIVADFDRYPKTLANLKKDVVAPYVHVVESFTNDSPPDPFESRRTLLFFRGRTHRKSKGVVRKSFEKILAGYDDVIYENSFATKEGINASSQGMRSSKFCLHPAGDTPSSCRLFDAIVSHCVPVIVSDYIELPFEDEIDYTQFSVFFSFNEALHPGYMVKKLRDFPKDRWTAMWKQLKNISHHYEFQYPLKVGDGTDMLWKQVRHKLPEAKLAVNRNKRLKIPDWWGLRR